MSQLIVALAAFVGTHFLLSHPLRAALVQRLGANGFTGLYSLVALVTFGWVAFAFRLAPLGALLWYPGDGLWALASLVMFVASVLLVGAFHGNPALPGPPAKSFVAPVPKGVFAITRHPMNWSFTLWSVAHVLVSPRPAVLILSLGIAVLAIVGSVGQDRKKARLVGDPWREWMRRTSFVPLNALFFGQISWARAWPGRAAMIGGTVLWLAATWLHPLLGAPTAGLWRWIG